MRALLICEDDDRIAWVEWTLLDEEFGLCVSGGREQLIEQAKSGDFGVILLDPHLRGTRGPELLKRLRTNGLNQPVIVVSDKGGVAEMAGIGAVAYIAVPADSDGTPCAASRSLISAVYASTGWTKTLPLVIEAGPFAFEFSGRWLKINGRRIVLSREELRIVKFLAAHPGQNFRADDLHRRLFSGSDDPAPAVIKVFIDHAHKIIKARAGGEDFLKLSMGAVSFEMPVH